MARIDLLDMAERIAKCPDESAPARDTARRLLDGWGELSEGERRTVVRSLHTRSRHAWDSHVAPDPQEGDRVTTLRADGTEAGSYGTVETAPASWAPAGGYALVDFDGGPHGVKRIKGDNLRVVGCQLCDGRGVTAELREGARYASPCRCCQPDADAGYCPDAEDPHVIAVY